MVQNPTTRPQFTISPGNPLITNSRNIEANPGTLAALSLGYADPSAIGAFTGCTSRTVTTPPTYTTEVCNEYLSTTNQLCTVGRTIVVDANSNYICSQTANAYQTQTCNRTLNAVVTKTPFCSITGTTTDLGSYTATILVFNPSIGKLVLTTTTVAYPHYLVVMGCVGDALASVTVSITAGTQCHANGCNSDYYSMTLPFVPGASAGPVTQNLARTYDLNWWETTTVSYDGASNVITISNNNNLTGATVTATLIPIGTVGMKNVITSSWINGCATQQAAAL